MMAVFNAVDYDHYALLEAISQSQDGEIEVLNLNGHRYLGCGWKNHKSLVLHGTAGNNLGAFCEGPRILLYGNGQEGVGNTMSAGEIIVHGRVGDIAGYSMRGGALYIRDDAGYRLGIHMKAYQDKSPVIVVGNRAGAFVGEYMAGGTIVVLGLNNPAALIGPYCGTGLYAGEIWLRGPVPVSHVAANVRAEVFPEPSQLGSIIPHLQRFATCFGYEMEQILNKSFTRLTVVDNRIFSHMYTGFTG